MLKELIVIENQKKYQFSDKVEIVKFLLGSNYYMQSKQKKLEQMEINALIKCKGTNLQITKIKGEENKEKINVKNKFIIYDEKTYILSLLLTNKIMLLESINSDVFTDQLDKTNIKENYIIVNKFAEELLDKYINR